MSFNLNTKVNNLQVQVNQLVVGTVTNPLTSNLNCNNNQLTNVNTVSSVSGNPLNLTAGASTVNIASAVNMVDALTITNNLAKNGLVVTDSIGDTSCFVVDLNGNVGVKVNPASTLTNDFTVNGSVSSSSLTTNVLTASGNINCANLTATGAVAVPAITGLSTINGVPYTPGGTPVLSLTNRSAQKNLSTGVNLNGDGVNYTAIDLTQSGATDVFAPIIQNAQINTIILTYNITAIGSNNGNNPSNQNFVTYRLTTSIDGGNNQLNQYLSNYNVPTNALVPASGVFAPDIQLWTGGSHTLTFYLYRGIHFTSTIANNRWTLSGVAQFNNNVNINYSNGNNIGFATNVTIFGTI